MLKIIFWVITIYFLYRLVFNFIIPVWRVSSKMRRQVREFQDTVNARQGYTNTSANANGFNTTAEPEPKKKKEGEYIEFEEITSEETRNPKL